MGRERPWLQVVAEGLEGLALLVPTVFTWPISRVGLTDLGSTADERVRPWAGDALLERVDRHTMRAIAIRAPREAVWPWIVQIGRKKAGFYSYELLENVAGFRVRNIERILPAHQHPQPGDFVELHPSGAGVWVAALTPPHELVFRDWRDGADLDERRPTQRGTWSFYLEPDGPGRCRLLVRGCAERLRRVPRWRRVLQSLLEQPLDLVMELRLLRTLKRLAEQGRSDAPHAEPLAGGHRDH